MQLQVKGEGDSLVLYQWISSAFCVLVILSNIISAKMVPLPFFDHFAIPAGLITYPCTFILSDLVTEIYGAKKAKTMVYITLGMNLLTFGILYLATLLPSPSVEEDQIFQAVLGLSGLRIFSSLVAYSIAQLIDIQIYALIKQWTDLKFLWIRSNGSTWISQLVDTIAIDMIFLYWGMGMEWQVVLPIMAFSVIYKIFFSLATTPVFYVLVYWVRRRMVLLKAI